jgi:hypothetical protein
MLSDARRILDYILIALRLNFIKFEIDVSDTAEVIQALNTMLKDKKINNQELAILIELILDKAGI